MLISHLPTAFATQASTSSNLALLGHVKKLQEVVHQKTKLEIGDVVRIRGHIRIYRGQREIQTSTYCEYSPLLLRESVCVCVVWFLH